MERGKLVAGSVDYCCSPPTVPRDWSCDHVVVLDGNWHRVGNGEDSDAPRRLYYVAMTRARQTLTLMRFPGPHPFQDTLSNVPAALFRKDPVTLPQPRPELARQYRRFSLSDVFLSFAGYRPANDPVHHAIAALSTGDPLQALPGQNRWDLLDKNGGCRGTTGRQFQASRRYAMYFRNRLGHRKLETRPVGAELPKEFALRRLGGGRAGAGIRALTQWLRC